MGGAKDNNENLNIFQLVSKTSLDIGDISKKTVVKKVEDIDPDLLKAIKNACDVINEITVVTAKVTCTMAGGKNDFLCMINDDETNMNLGNLSALTKKDIQMSNSGVFKKCLKTEDKKCPGAVIISDGWELTDNKTKVKDELESPYTEKSCMVCIEGGAIYFLNSGQIPSDFEEAIENSKHNINIKKVILQIIKQENGLNKIDIYLQELRNNYPDVNDFFEILAYHESRGKYNAQRDGSQFLGRYQIGTDILIKMEFKDENDNWTKLAQSFGVASNEEFLNNHTAQEVAVIFAFRWYYQTYLSNKNNEFVGDIVDGIELTESGIVGGMHLIGVGDMNNALNGVISWEAAVDGFGTPALFNVEEMGGLDLSILWGGIE